MKSTNEDPDQGKVKKYLCIGNPFLWLCSYFVPHIKIASFLNVITPVLGSINFETRLFNSTIIFSVMLLSNFKCSVSILNSLTPLMNSSRESIFIVSHTEKISNTLDIETTLIKWKSILWMRYLDITNLEENHQFLFYFPSN